MKKTLQFFTANLFWKILSVIFAIAFWIVAVAINNPIQNGSMSIPLTLINLNELTNNGYILLNQDELETTEIEIKFNATRTMIDTLENAKDDIKALLDLKPLDIAYGFEMGENIPLTVQVFLPDYLSSLNQNFEELEGYITISPKYVDVVLDKFITREVSVSVIVTGEPVDSYIDTTPISTPNTIKISGAQSKVSLIKNVEATIDISDATKDVKASSSLIILDGNREPVSNIDVSSSEVEITVPIKKNKSVPLSIDVFGTVKTGFEVISVDIEPTHIEIFGSEEEVDNFKALTLNDIDITDFSETTSQTIDVRPYLLDTSLNVKNNTPHEVTVTVNIGEIVTERITVQTGDISIIGLEDFMEIPDSISFSITGLEHIVESYVNSDITGRLNLSNLDYGTHNVAVDFFLPKGLEFVNKNPSITVKIIDTSIVVDEENPDIN